MSESGVCRRQLLDSCSVGSGGRMVNVFSGECLWTLRECGVALVLFWADTGLIFFYILLGEKMVALIINIIHTTLQTQRDRLAGDGARGVGCAAPRQRHARSLYASSS